MTTALETIPLNTISGAPATLGDYAGQVRLVVNVASKCGLTPQYAGLEALYQQFKSQGFSVLGFPANNFAGQEPGSEDEIASFCSTGYDVHFPLFAKINAVGPDKHPVYAALTAAIGQATNGAAGSMRDNLIKYGMTPNEAPELLWNFEKFLIGREGEVIGRFAPNMTPDDPILVGAIEAALRA